MVVEADFADRARARRRFDLISDDSGRSLGVVGKLVRLMRVDANRKPRLGPELLEVRRLRGFLLIPCLEDHHDALEPRLFRARDDGIEVRGEDLVCQMAMAIDH
jgi:hypothetical protein